MIDTVVSGFGDQSSGNPNPPLADTGVPFIFVDVAGAPGCAACGVNNGVNYFYSGSPRSTSTPRAMARHRWSARVTKQVVPQATAGNFDNSHPTQSGVFGRKGLLTDATLPTPAR